jgi:extradiol dioxygenase family protein
MHASAAGAKARLLNARSAVDMIATEAFLCEIVGCRSAILEGWSNSDISGADIVTHSSPSGRDTSKKPGRQFTVDK